MSLSRCYVALSISFPFVSPSRSVSHIDLKPQRRILIRDIISPLKNQYLHCEFKCHDLFDILVQPGEVVDSHWPLYRVSMPIRSIIDSLLSHLLLGGPESVDIFKQKQRSFLNRMS